MLRYFLTIAAMIGAPLIALILHYAPLDTDNLVTLPVTDYRLNGNILTYETPLNHIQPSDLVASVKPGLTQGDIHLTAASNDTAYPYLITPKGDKPNGGLKDGGFFLSGEIMQINETQYKLRYHNEKLALPRHMVEALSSANNPQLKAVWHIRSNGRSRLAGLNINGEFLPYQFSLKDVLLGLTQ